MIQILTEDPNPPRQHKNPFYPQVKRESPEWSLVSWGGAVHLHYGKANFDRPLTADEFREAAEILRQAADELDGETLKQVGVPR